MPKFTVEIEINEGQLRWIVNDSLNRSNRGTLEEFREMQNEIGTLDSTQNQEAICVSIAAQALIQIVDAVCSESSTKTN